MKGMSRQVAEKLLLSCGDLDTLFNESAESWREILGITAPLFDETSREKALSAADAEMAFIEKSGITPLFLPTWITRLGCMNVPTHRSCSISKGTGI